MLSRPCAASTAAAITAVSLGNTGSTASPAHTAASSRYVHGEPETAFATESNTCRWGYPGGAEATSVCTAGRLAAERDCHGPDGKSRWVSLTTPVSTQWLAVALPFEQ
jgi:hypothetical protein